MRQKLGGALPRVATMHTRWCAPAVAPAGEVERAVSDLCANEEIGRVEQNAPRRRCRELLSDRVRQRERHFERQ